ncbi:transmembrane protein 248-like [Diadema setosum]|uniref:transmembrane protein 248-like n=1 Tax=Diadema setosum TaxID=31175 RepID=UPI003B3AF1DE
MTVKPIENLKGFSANRPPFVVFTICILLFAIALISLGAYIKRSEIPDYDIDYDWNTLLQGFSKLEFCLSPNETTAVDVLSTTTTSLPLNSSLSPGTTTSSDPMEEVDGLSLHNTSLSISLSLRAHHSIHTEVHYGTTHLFSTFTASSLGIEDGSEQMYITFDLLEPLKPLPCSEAGCSDHLSACLTIKGPQYIFPHTRHPGVCNVTDTTKQDKVTKMHVKPSSNTDLVQWCKEGTVAKANHQFDPRLTVMLSPAQRSLVNLHLMYTSYFLFVMLVTCVCYALVKGPPAKHRTVTQSTIKEKKISAPI